MGRGYIRRARVISPNAVGWWPLIGFALPRCMRILLTIIATSDEASRIDAGAQGLRRGAINALAIGVADGGTLTWQR